MDLAVVVLLVTVQLPQLLVFSSQSLHLPLAVVAVLQILSLDRPVSLHLLEQCLLTVLQSSKLVLALVWSLETDG